jgi:ketosteroid isomerase-like protein
MATQTTAKTDGAAIVEALGRAYAERDLGALVDLYAGDAEFRTYSHTSPPASPFELRGKEAIGKYFKEVPSEIQMRIVQAVVGDGAVAIRTLCTYPDGKAVAYAALLDVRDGKIVREVGVEAWDD